MTIWKYGIEISDEQVLMLPIGAQILTAQMHHEVLSIWAIVNPNPAALEQRHILIFGTGHPLPERLQETSKHIATVQQGIYVWHVFERLVSQPT